MGGMPPTDPGGLEGGSGPANAALAPLAAPSVTDVDLEAAGSRRLVSRWDTHEVGAVPLGPPHFIPTPGEGRGCKSGAKPR